MSIDAAKAPRPFGNPMLAGKIKTNAEVQRLKFPVFVQPKVDGYRVLIKGGKAYSRSLKLIPNKHVQAWATANKGFLEGFDGELVVGPANAENVFKRTRAIGGRNANLDFQMILFDMWNLQQPYKYRLESAHILGIGIPRVVTIGNYICNTPEEVLMREQQILDQGYEGIIIRSPAGPYKNNRSTINEGWLLAIKRWSSAEAVIKSVEPLMKNENEAFIDERGYTKRSSSKEGKVAQNTLGRLVCDFTWPEEYPNAGKTVEVKIGSGKGLDDALRKKLWKYRENLPGRHVEFEFFAPGSDEAPRHIKFLRMREKWDI